MSQAGSWLMSQGRRASPAVFGVKCRARHALSRKVGTIWKRSQSLRCQAPMPCGGRHQARWRAVRQGKAKVKTIKVTPDPRCDGPEVLCFYNCESRGGVGIAVAHVPHRQHAALRAADLPPSGQKCQFRADGSERTRALAQGSHRGPTHGPALPSIRVRP